MSVGNKSFTDWFFQYELGCKAPPRHHQSEMTFLKSLFDVAGADGVLSESERDWILGFAFAFGASEEMMNQLKVYKPGDCSNVQDLFKNVDFPYVQKMRYGIVYNGFRAASADGELHAKEIEAIYDLAKKLGVTDKQVEQIRSLCDEENKLRQKRVSILFPDGFGDAVAEFEKHYT